MRVLKRTPNDLLLTKLLEKQGSLSDYKFARMLGVPRSSWVNTRLQKRPIGFALLKAIARIFKDDEKMTEAILILLRDGAGGVNGNDG